MSVLLLLLLRMHSTDLLVGYVTSDIVSDKAAELDDVLIPMYLKTEHEGFLTAAYTYDGQAIAAHACNPTGGTWRTVAAFEPANKVSVAGIGVQNRMRVFGKDREEATDTEQALLNALDDIYDRRVRGISVLDAQLEAAQSHQTCPTEKRTETTLTLVEKDSGAAAVPVVCRKCMRLHAIISDGKRQPIAEVLCLGGEETDIQLFGNYTVRHVEGWDAKVSASSLWYESKRESGRKPHPVATGRETWLLVKDGMAVGYITWDAQQSPILRDIYVTDDERGNGLGSRTITQWLDVIGNGEPVLVEASDDCVSFVKNAAPVEENIVETHELVQLELGEEVHSDEV